MAGAGARRTRGPGVALLALALLALGLGAFAASGGEFGIQVAGLRVSLHNPANPLLAAVLLWALGVILSGLDTARRVLDEVSRFADSAAPWLAGALSAGVFVTTLQWGAFVAGGADSSGYMSQARLWRTGSLTVATPLAAELRLVNGQQPFTPLGYRPARVPGSVVPSYPPGFPWMLAAAGPLGLDSAVVPLTAGGLVWLTYVLGRRLGGPAAGLVGAALAAGSPTLWYQAVQPMSDVPAAFWLTLGVVLLSAQADGAAFGAGLATSAAALVRPNLFVLMPLLGVCALWWEQSWRVGLRKVMLFALPVLAAAAWYTAFQRVTYGAATETGYGNVVSLFSLDHVLPNLARYPAWLVSTHTGLILTALAAPFVTLRDPRSTSLTGRNVRLAWGGLLVFATLLGFYSLYFVFEEWVYVRFLLPGLPWVFALVGVTLAGASRRLPNGWSGTAVLLASLVLATSGIERVRQSGTFRVADGEQRFVAIADFVQSRPPESVFLAMQHSGSLAYYTDRLLLRWDWIDRSESERVVEDLSAQGRPVFAVLEDWEEPQFRERFRGTGLDELPEPLITAGLPEAITTRVYLLNGTRGPSSAAPVSR